MLQHLPTHCFQPCCAVQLEQIATSASAEQGLGYVNTRDALNISLA